MISCDPRRLAISFLAALALACPLMPVREAHALGIGLEFGLSPHWNWKTLETPHFVVTFPADLAVAATRFARHLEEAHTLLAPGFHWEPRTRTQVLVVDNSDMANGLTSAAGRFGMLLYTTPPESFYSTYYYDDWMRFLVIHEYTHFLNMDATFGVWQGLRYVFGDVLLPNSIWPDWMLEGLAVYEETRHSRAGRGRSPFYEAILRAAVEEEVLDQPQFITLDRINGTNPYFPLGETPYFFGYQLMNQVARDARIGSRTADNENPLPGPESALGEMSRRSAWRVPFLINGNLENITGRSWYSYWASWLEETRERMGNDLKRIQSQPLTALTTLTQKGLQTLGPSVSPDGKWLAYLQEASDQRNSLLLRDLQTGETRTLTKRIPGSQTAFTPDSRYVLFSSIERAGKYGFFSDLSAVDLATGEEITITHALRVRDPDISRDGKWITFTLTENQTTGLAVAPLLIQNGKPALGPIRKLYRPDAFGRATNPRFSPDGRRVVFSVHPNGERRNDLLETDLETGRTTALVSDGSFNRYPTFSPSSGELHFVSDATGIDNLYRFMPGTGPQLVSNVTTALISPAFAPDGRTVYASVLSSRGWNLARFTPSPVALSREAATVSPPPAPPVDPTLPQTPALSEVAIEDYSALPTLWPRQWAPILLFSSEGSSLGGYILGFDALDIHQYVLQAAYETDVKEMDWAVAYSNRSLGPTLSLSAENQTTFGNASAFVRQRRLKLGISDTFPGTFSSLTPSLLLSAERKYLYAPGASPATGDLIERGPFVPYIESGLRFSNTRRSRLAIAPEEGRSTEFASRTYFRGGDASWKFLLKDTEFFHLGGNHVLQPSIAMSWTSSANFARRSNTVVVDGRYSSRVVNTFGSNSLDQLSIRGYSGNTYIARMAVVTALDYRFPLLRVFRGMGTNPAFFESLHGFTFLEATTFPEREPGVPVLPSAGGGVRMDSTLFKYVPLTLSLEYHYGFRTDVGGGGELFFQIGAAGLSF